MTVTIRNIEVGDHHPLILIAGPCVVESRDMIFFTAERLKTVCARLHVPLIFKSSYKKANRTSASGFQTIGEEESLRILQDAGAAFDLPLITDVHSEAEVARAADVVDVLQIPAFLCRQTDLLEAAGRTGKAVNIKKGQFLAPEEMRFAAEKVTGVGNPNVMLTERGTSFGHHDLVVDFRGLPLMRATGFPVIYDATHSVQIPSKGGKSGGRREFILPLARAAVAVGCDGLFAETHPHPATALSDADSQLALSHIEEFLLHVLAIDEAEHADSESDLE